MWWVWTVEPFILHPIQTIKDAFRKSEPISQDELDALTPEERKALRHESNAAIVAGLVVSIGALAVIAFIILYLIIRGFL